MTRLVSVKYPPQKDKNRHAEVMEDVKTALNEQD